MNSLQIELINRRHSANFGEGEIVSHELMGPRRQGANLGRLIDYSDSEEDVPRVVDWETVARAQQPVTTDVLRSADVGTTFALEDRNCVAHTTWRRVLVTVSGSCAMKITDAHGLIINEPSEGVSLGCQSRVEFIEEFNADGDGDSYYRNPHLRRAPRPRHQEHALIQSSPGRRRATTLSSSESPTARSTAEVELNDAVQCDTATENVEASVEREEEAADGSAAEATESITLQMAEDADAVASADVAEDSAQAAEDAAAACTTFPEEDFPAADLLEAAERLEDAAEQCASAESRDASPEAERTYTSIQVRMMLCTIMLNLNMTCIYLVFY
ncbi:hypothetical protein AB1Y20_008095 [Prymnesium parvum]|uniref:Uncharacterized protein n=1 Tax=Prymnesium parvum TaxID=97485 RepID=A0AB34IVM8_PRYPA